MYLFTKKENTLLHSSQVPETVINASRLIKKFDHWQWSLSINGQVDCQKQQTYCLELHFLDFVIANLFMILVVYFA